MTLPVRLTRRDANRLLLAGGAAAVLGSSAAAQLPKPATRPPLGMNLAGVTDWSSELVFVDAFQAARAWISQSPGKAWGQGGPLDVDSQGHVRSLRDDQYAETIVFTDFGDRFPPGVYTCLYDGDGEVQFTGDARIVETAPGKQRVDIQPRTGQATLRIMRTDPNDPVRRLRLIALGHGETYASQPFRPDFLERWRGFRAFRFMDWGRTNDSRLVDWADRPTLDTHSQALRGVAVEYMLALCNQLEVDCWICLPHRASDDYVRSCAHLVKQELKPGLRAYIEYSNECWNTQFEQARYCRDEGRRLGLSPNDYEAQLRYYAQRSVEIFSLWEQEFGGRRRLVRVLATQAANLWTGQTVLAWNNAAAHADAIAIAPYFGNRWGSPRQAEQALKLSVDELLATLADDVAASRSNIEAYAELARRYRLQLAAYEGGQHLVGHGGAENNEPLMRLFHAANRHPRMKEHYLQHLADWQAAGGGMFCVFSSMGKPSKWGSWGVLEHAGQTVADAPKYAALREYLAGSPE